MAKGRIIGVGGVFFTCEDPKATKDWYGQHLGLKTDDWGATFKSLQVNDPKKSAYLQWSPFKQGTKHFDPGKQDFMMNYRVEHIDDLVAQLKSEGVVVLDEIVDYDYGRFVHILDGDGRKVELWEPVDEAFDAPDTISTNY